MDKEIEEKWEKAFEEYVKLHSIYFCLPIDAYNMKAFYVQVRRKSQEEIDGLLSRLQEKENEISKLEAHKRLLQSCIDRWVPCPDHRDKTERGKCYICEIEEKEKRIKGLEELTKDMGSDKALSEVLYEYHERADRAEARIKELKEGVKIYLAGWDKDGPNWNTDILEKLLEPK